MRLIKSDSTKELELKKIKEEEEKNDRLKRQLEAVIRGLEHELEMILQIKRNHTK